MSTGREVHAGFGTASLSLVCGAKPASTATEEFTGESTSVNVKDLTQS